MSEPTTYALPDEPEGPVTTNPHRWERERTNYGCFFTDCTCGWSGGVYRSSSEAHAAWKAHRDGKPIPDSGRMRPLVQVPPPMREVVEAVGEGGPHGCA